MAEFHSTGCLTVFLPETSLKFSYDIVIHEADWRGGLRWMSSTYPEYFNPVNSVADEMAGTGGYSDSDVDFDVEKMKKMSFSVNWRASFDFPYMGMFIPPVSQGMNHGQGLEENQHQLQQCRIC